jgi:hypothetical protein
VDKGEVSNLALLQFVNEALIQMGDELRFRVVEDGTSLALVANVQDYALSSDVLSVLWVSHNERRLDPIGISARDRDLEDWRSQDSGTPTEFGIRGRRLYLFPAPSAAAVSDDGVLSYSYVGAPPDIGPSGPTGLSDSDQLLLAYWAALDYCIANPSEMNTARVQGYVATKETMLARARERWVGEGASAAKHHSPSFRPWTGGRQGGAR